MPSENIRLNLKNQESRKSFSLLLTTEDLTVKFKGVQSFKKGAVVVSKTTAKKAVDRNRTRRIILEGLRRTDIKGEFIFIAKKNISNYKKSQIDELFEKIKSKLRV